MVSLLVFRNLLNGQFSPINQFLMDIGVISENIGFLSDPVSAKVVVILVSFSGRDFQLLDYDDGCVIKYGSKSYDKFSIDGANHIQSFQKITLPLVFRATMPNLVMSMAANFNGFGLIYFLTQGGPTNTEMQFA